MADDAADRDEETDARKELSRIQQELAEAEEKIDELLGDEEENDEERGQERGDR